MSAFGGKADMTLCGNPLAQRACRTAAAMHSRKLSPFSVRITPLIVPHPDAPPYPRGKGKQLYRPLTVTISLSFGHPREAEMGLEIWREITTEYNGRAIKGSFKFLDGVVTVRTLRGSKAAQVRGQTPEQLAKTLLRELARDGMA